MRHLKAVACLVILLPATSAADLSETLAGSFEGELDGRRVLLTSLENHYEIAVSGDVANVKLTQTFTNPYDRPLNARYLFPLNRRAAVHAMTMRIGTEVISAELREREQARQTFEEAKAAGKAASLLAQQRPNMFTQRIANLMPGSAIRVEIEYAQLVPRIDGAYELVVPMVVGPRFQPAEAGVSPVSSDAGETPNFGRWQLEALPAYPPTAGVHLPASVLGDRVSLAVELEAPLPIVSADSDTHPLTVRHRSSTQQSITLARRRTLDNRDFVLRYELAGKETGAGLLTHWEPEEGGYFALLIEPPAEVTESEALAREMVFLLDCSGSMNGAPMTASKRFMAEALAGLRSTDRFRIIRFSDSATEFSSTALAATPANIQRGLSYTRSLSGSGGTVMTSGIRQALSGPMPENTVRNVVFLTDGYIGNEVSVLALVKELLGDARLFAFGVGAGVNRYLLDELGRVGRGFTRYYDPTRDDESQEAVAAALAARLQTPVLTGLELDWGTLPVTDVLPAELPDLYAGDSLRITGRYTAPAVGIATLRGTSAAQQATMHQQIELEDTSTRPALRRLWGRAAVAERMHAFLTPPALRPDAASNDALRAAVTELGLRYRLATRWTSFVAVSRQVHNSAPQQNAQAQVALPKVAGVGPLAYGGPVMTGHAAPEPGLWLGLLTASAVLLAYRSRRRPQPSAGVLP
jgi:Ca-activated chloride channel family protein